VSDLTSIPIKDVIVAKIDPRIKSKVENIFFHEYTCRYGQS